MTDTPAKQQQQDAILERRVKRVMFGVGIAFLGALISQPNPQDDLGKLGWVLGFLASLMFLVIGSSGWEK